MIYFDNAATSLQKPAAVPEAVARAIRCCSSPGRGDYPSSQRAEKIMFDCRSELAELFDAQGPEQVVFTQNATHALNLAIRSLVHPGDAVLVSPWEHNAVTRTIASIPDVNMLVAQAPLFDDAQTLAAFAGGLEERPAAVVCTCVSNVFGYILPVEEIAELCRRSGVPLILDAAQAAGCIPLSARRLGAAYIAFPGHKGLYGPQGTGALICGGEAGALYPVLTGGTGSESARQEMPAFLPDRGEAGTQNVAGVAGLLQGVRFVRRMSVERIASHEAALLRRLERRLEHMPRIRPFFSGGVNQGGVASFVCDGVDCQTLAQRLGEHGVAVRAGLHCAPLAHRSAGTLESGTVRVSFSAFNRMEEVDAFVRCLNHSLITN